MSDLISRESAMELIEIVFEDAIYGGEFIDAYEPVKTAIMAVSAEELPEPKRGRWENREGYDNWNCSECDHEIVGYDENPVEYGELLRKMRCIYGVRTARRSYMEKQLPNAEIYETGVITWQTL